ncbi:MAG: hypothetical protein AAB558_03765, partial [Patescibacteria group bacterium]
MNHYTEIAISQKAHDLLTVWLLEKKFAPKHMKKHFVKVFDGKNREIFIGEEKIPVGNPGGQKKFSFETFFLDENLKPARLGITVFD